MATYHPDGFYWSRERFVYESDEQLTNVFYMTNFLRDQGWTDTAIAGFLGNVQSESGFNPGAYYDWQDFSSISFGIVQWDPTSKYQNWHDEHFPGVMYEHLGCQLSRIVYEMENGLQFYPGDDFDITFKEFSKSTLDAGTLAQVFLLNYEKPASVLYDPKTETWEEHQAKKKNTMEQRAKQGLHWFEVIGGVAPTPPPGIHKGMSILDIILYGGRKKLRVVR